MLCAFCPFLVINQEWALEDGATAAMKQLEAAAAVEANARREAESRRRVKEEERKVTDALFEEERRKQVLPPFSFLPHATYNGHLSMFFFLLSRLCA